MDDDLYMMMGDDPLVYQSPPVLSEEGRTGDVITNSTNHMLDVVNDKKQRKGNRRQNNSNRNRNRHRNNNNNQNDGILLDDNPINVISAFNRTSKIYNKLRKNDAVKVIDTPSGRAGFVYQSSSGSGSSSNNNSPSVKESNPNWEDSYSQNHFVNRNANDVKLIPHDDTSNKKIIPVLTSDGKIALVVRGDTSRSFDDAHNNGSGNSVSSKKYEPITNLTSIITALNSNNDNNVNNKQNDSSISVGLDALDPLKTVQEQNRLINRLDEFFASVTNKVKHIEEVVEHELGIEVEDAEEGEESDATTPTTTTTDDSYDQEDHKKNLLQINRPLSEVLGLPKKTHYHHPLDPIHSNPEPSFTRPPSNTENRRINTANKVEVLMTTTEPTTEAEEIDHDSSINIAVIPGFDSEMEERLFGKNRDNTNRNINEVSETSGAISSVHCTMQAMLAIICACTIFGVLGAYYKVEIVNQVRIFYW